MDAKCALQAAPADFNPYRALAMMAVLPTSSVPKISDLQVTHTFSLHTALRYAFPISQANTFSPFKAASKKPMQTLYLDATDKYDKCGATSGFLCPPATRRAFWVKSCFTSNIK